jgi:hypothetical protein
MQGGLSESSGRTLIVAAGSIPGGPQSRSRSTPSDGWPNGPNCSPGRLSYIAPTSDATSLRLSGTCYLGKITPSTVRSWNAALAREHPVTAAKAYRLLSGILATAEADELIGRNPCVVEGASQERSPERPMLSIAEVDALTAALPEP